MFGPVVRRIQARDLQEREQLIPMMIQVLGEPGVLRIRVLSGQQVIHLGVEVPLDHKRSVIGHLPGDLPVPRLKALLENRFHAAREPNRPAGHGLLYLVATVQQVVQTLLVDGLCEPVIGQLAIVDHDAGEVDPEHALRNDGAAMGVDHVAGQLRVREHVKPLADPADTPSGLVHRHHRLVR